jgi:hypothetical protein
MLKTPGDDMSPPSVWCEWLSTTTHLTEQKAILVIRLANALRNTSDQRGIFYVPCAWVENTPSMVAVSNPEGGWMYVEDLFSELPEDLQKWVVCS